MKSLHKFFSVLLIFTLGFFAINSNTLVKAAAEITVPTIHDIEISAKSAVLMEAKTGAILYSKNENEALPPASVTKIMTLLLAAEALDEGKFSLTDTVSISAKAASMGGSQVFLEEGEKIGVEDLFKCTVIASANDAALALAELVCGSEEAFINRMNGRAHELGLNSTYFENVTGLDDTTTKHLTSALDIAKMSRELMKHDIILKYSSIWQDTIRNGDFTLTNTNRLVRFYDGCNGLKTGSTSKAGYCMSATAKRDGMQLIAVIMGADTRDIRNAEAKKLLDIGFSDYSLYCFEEKTIKTLPVLCGTVNEINIKCENFSVLIPKGSEKNIKMIYELPEELTAPIDENEIVGKIKFSLNDKIIGESNLYSESSIARISVIQIFIEIVKCVFVNA